MVDFVVANILAQPIIELAPTLLASVRPGGMVALSGILQEQVATVTAAYCKEVDFEPPMSRDGWVLLSGRRRDGPA